MTYLLDTNVLSEARRRRPEPKLVAWLEATESSDLYLSVLTIGEIRMGITRRRRKDPTAADILEHWAREIEETFSDRIIPVDTSIARIWGELNRERPLPVVDALLAATAIKHDLTLVTRNVKDIASTGVSLINPWTDWN